MNTLELRTWRHAYDTYLRRHQQPLPSPTTHSISVIAQLLVKHNIHDATSLGRFIRLHKSYRVNEDDTDIYNNLLYQAYVIWLNHQRHDQEWP